MNNLINVLKNLLKNKNEFFLKKKKDSNNAHLMGKDLELFFKSFLNKNNFQEIEKIKIEPKKIKKLLKKILDKYDVRNIYNDDFKLLENKYIFQPNGSQSPPDFLVFLEKFIIPIEIKFSKNQTIPKWNSNLPKQNFIYVFGSSKKEDITIFLATDILNNDLRISMIDYFKKLKKQEKEKLDAIYQEKEFLNLSGLIPSIRVDFLPNSKFINPKNTKMINFFDNNKKTRENNVIEYLKKLNS